MQRTKVIQVHKLKVYKTLNPVCINGNASHIHVIYMRALHINEQLTICLGHIHAMFINGFTTKRKGESDAYYELR